MGCKYACVCSGRCITCTRYEREEYVGHAEDYYDQVHGRNRNNY